MWRLHGMASQGNYGKGVGRGGGGEPDARPITPTSCERQGLNADLHPQETRIFAHRAEESRRRGGRRVGVLALWRELFRIDRYCCRQTETDRH